ncbi:MAG: glycosyltransferase family 39 protein, partial [Candidatus Aminicenantes bacterium]|nr:glycosyltransferase family 39 protein [Candidatus Aminicenantes bacterium]
FIFLLGVLLRLVGLGSTILYWDEPLHCIRIAAQSLPFVLKNNDGSALFALLVHLLIPLGKLEVMARFPSFIFGTATILTTYGLGKVLFSKREGLLGALFVALSPLLIRYSQYSRSYSTFAFFSMLSLYFFLKAVKQNQTKHWLGFCLASVLNLYNHLFSFFLLPVFGIYAGISGLRGLIIKKTQNKRTLHADIFFKFIFWIMIVLVLIVLLYLPDEGAQTFISDSLDKATIEAPEELAPMFPFSEVLRNLLAPQSSATLFLILFLAVVGLIELLRKDKFLAVLLILYFTVPYTIFILINPSPAHMLSLWRYMTYILPLLLLFLGRGILSLSSRLSILITRLKTLTQRRDVVLKVIAGIFFLFFLFRGFDYKSYYLDFWRLNTLKIKSRISDYLRENIKKDSFIFFDTFPASNLILLANPLTKGLTVEEFELPIRENLPSKGTRHKIMIYRARQEILEWYTSSPADLWVVSPLNQKNKKPLLDALSENPAILLENDQDYAYLHFNDSQMPLWEKLNLLSDIFLQLDLDPQKRADFHMIAARALLLGERFEEAVGHLKKARLIAAESFSPHPAHPPRIQRILDPLFGLNPQKVREIAWDNFLRSDIAKLLIRQGDTFRRETEDDLAVLFYEECSKISADYPERASNRIAAIAHRHFNNGQWKNAIVYAKKALEVNPERFDLPFFLGEAYRKDGRVPEFIDIYSTFVKGDALSEKIQEKLLSEDPLLTFLKTESSLILIFRADNRARFEGKVEGRNKIKNVVKGFWTPRDTAEFLKNKLSFDLELSGGQIRTLEIKTSKKCEYSIDLRINGQRDTRKILVLDNTVHIKNIPFSLD